MRLDWQGLEAQLDDGLLSSGFIRHALVHASFTLLSRSTEQPPESGNPLERRRSLRWVF